MLELNKKGNSVGFFVQLQKTNNPIINRLCVGGAVLQTAFSLIDY